MDCTNGKIEIGGERRTLRDQEEAGGQAPALLSTVALGFIPNREMPSVENYRYDFL